MRATWFRTVWRDTPSSSAMALSVIPSAMRASTCCSRGVSSGVGSLRRFGSPARDLNAKLETIKANLGFDQLQAMREASPTGGALGQVAVQELTALQATVSSLDQAQSPAQLAASLGKIEQSYNRWQMVTNKSRELRGLPPITVPTAPQAPQAPQAPTAPQAPQAANPFLEELKRRQSQPRR